MAQKAHLNNSNGSNTNEFVSDSFLLPLLQTIRLFFHIVSLVFYPVRVEYHRHCLSCGVVSLYLVLVEGKDFVLE